MSITAKIRRWTTAAAPAPTRGTGRSIRLRLTLTYGLLFLLGGLVLIAITYLLMRHAAGPLVVVRDTNPSATAPITQFGLDGLSAEQQALAADLRASAERQRQSDLDQLLVWASIALAITTVVAVAAGWFVAGRALRPLRAMTTTARQISQHNLHERLDVRGPRDEVKDLGETINDLLARIQTAFHVQRRFIANASHELRTPLTWNRTLIEVTLADPNPDVVTLRSAQEELLASIDEQERLIDALLTLATSERGLGTKEEIDLAELFTDAVLRVEPAANSRGVTVATRIEPAHVSGNHDLLRRLADNLLDNAVHHNVAGGRVAVRTRTGEDGAVLTVANTGARLTRSDVERIIEPFQRLDTARYANRPGHGLGLSIVEAIVTAHGGRLTVRPRHGGGLVVNVLLR